jgi:hypothetical protein
MQNKADVDGRFNGEGRKYQAQSLWNLHHEILRLAVLGTKHVDIAKELNITPATVSNCLNGELGRKQLAIMRGARDAETIDVAIEIRRNAPKAYQVLMEYLENPDFDPRQRITIAMDQLDRAGYAAPKVIETRGTHLHLTPDDIRDIKQRAQDNNMAIDVPLIEESNDNSV